MVSRKVFLEVIEKLQVLFPEPAMSEKQFMLYYEALSPDFTDEQFLKQVNSVIKNCFKFPPIAAFYREDATPAPTVDYGVVKPADTEKIRKILAEYEGPTS
jgi:hypothetical protein